MSGAGRTESGVAGAQSRGSRPADSTARGVLGSIRPAAHPQPVSEVLGRREGAVSGAGWGSLSLPPPPPPGSEVGGRGLGTEALLGRPSLLRRSCPASLRPFPASPARDWAPLGSRPAFPPAPHSAGNPGQVDSQVKGFVVTSGRAFLAEGRENPSLLHSGKPGEKETATHSTILAWRIPGTEGPGGLPSMGSHRVGHD